MPLQSGGGTWGTDLYAVRGVGSESRDVDAWHANGLYAEDRGLQVPMALKHGPVTSSGKSAPGPDPRIRHRIQIDMFRPIRMDHTKCLQVAVKTLQFRNYSSPPKPFSFSTECMSNYLQQHKKGRKPRVQNVTLKL
jgi:hypothetical protein